MTNQIKRYFLAPSWDYPPGGTIALGNIIISPTRPVPALVIATAASEPEGLISSNKNRVEWQKGKTHAHKFGIWTKLLVDSLTLPASIPKACFTLSVEFLGVNVGIDVSSQFDDLFRFEKMHTEEFFPNDEYIKALLEKSPVATRILKKQHKALFVIVGVKTVSGAVVKRAQSGSISGSLDVSVDAAVAGSPAPASVGPSVVSSSGSNESVSFEGSDDFVFAFRVQKLRMRRREEEVRQEDYIKGAMFEYGAGGTKGLGRLEIDDLKDSEGFDELVGHGVGDEDEEVLVYVPKIGLQG